MLADHFVKPSSALCRINNVEGGGDHQHITGITPGLAKGRHDVGEAGAGDGKTDAGFTGRPGKTVRHEARALFMAGQDVVDLRTRQGPVHFHIVHTRNAEDGPDAIGLKQADEGLADRCFRLLL